MKELQDLVGQIFGRLFILSQNHEDHGNSRERFWNCQCECGTTTVVRTASLTGGSTQSCGCLQRERTSEARTTHGMTGSLEYYTWTGIIARCENPDTDAYYRYGGRGIKMCSRWRSSFENFYADMGPKPSSNHTIERLDNDGDYELGNCVWATKTEQANNRRTNIIVEKDGAKMTLAQAVIGSAIDYKTVYQRMFKDGMTFQEASTTPLREANKYEAFGESLTLQEWSTRYGVAVTTIEYRLKNDWELEKAISEPVYEKMKLIVDGKEYTYAELSATFGIPQWKLRQRIGRDGMSAQEAVKKP